MEASQEDLRARETNVRETASTPSVSKSMHEALHQLRNQLIDLGTRNRLLHTPMKGRGAKQLRVVDERSDAIFEILGAGRKMTFDPSSDSSDAEQGIGEDDDLVLLPSDEEEVSEGLAERHTDSKLQTQLGPEQLQKRLLNIFREARTLEEEQGVSVLFLALGFLRWYESPTSEIDRYAPLVLYPVDLVRDKARGRFKLVARDEEMEVNLSLSARLKNDFGLALPDFPSNSDWLPSDYFEMVEAIATEQPRWEVERNTIQLGFFSFAKFRMWQDLDEANNWPEGCGPYESPLLRKLLVRGFDKGGNVTDDAETDDAENLDRRFVDLRSLGHILDADSSQAQVIAAAMEGEDLVVQGPPGTGKSQTIANIIAVAAGQNKRVLFISEKRAALDVVHDRLQHAGLAPLCLELHSHKANRKHVFEDLKDTLELAPLRALDEAGFDQARETRDELNRVSSLLHKLDTETQQTPFLVMGRLAELAEQGVTDPGFRIDGAERWTPQEYEDRIAATRDLAEVVRQHGREFEHPWRGATKRLGPIERQQFEADLVKAVHSLDRLRSLCQETEAMTGVAPTSPFSELPLAIERLVALSEMPAQVSRLMERDAVVSEPARILTLCENIARAQALRAGLSKEVVDSALELRWEEHRLALAMRGNSFWRFLRKDYRQALARLRGVVRDQLPKTMSERLDLLDRILDFRKLCSHLASNEEFARHAFKASWNVENTDVSEMLPAARWIARWSENLESGKVLRERVEQSQTAEGLQAVIAEFRERFGEWRAIWSRIEDTLGLDLPAAFDKDALLHVAPVAVFRKLRMWTDDLALLDNWHLLAAKAKRASELGLDEVRIRLADGRLQTDQVESSLALVRADALWTKLCTISPELKSMNGESRSQLVRRFKELDQELLALAARVVADKHVQGLPKGSSGEIGIVRGEANKKTRHMKIRRLLSVAGEAVATVKPIFLMSPMSVAQYLAPDSVRFDLLLIDEASQVKPAEAIGAICRAKQIVVVGDQKQMPPSSFFDRQTSNTDDHDEQALDQDSVVANQLGDMESILSLCDARAMRGGTLRWHYRSKHESLIAVSNHEFYRDRLICPPSPEVRSTAKGFSFTKVDGHFLRGKGRNPIEAEAIAKAVLAHSREKPGETLGVVAMSVAQRDAIQNKLELMRAEFPELDAFCDESKEEEPFFVKNLENVQGDERDAIFVSIGYGRDENGMLSNNFGPVSKDGGERRLNVLFTRAKLRCRIFSNMVHSDIRTEAAKSRGAQVLKRFLKYAETGDLDLPFVTGKGFDSPFEEAVASALAKHGVKTTPQVGSKGFLIDLAVHDPDCEGRYILAVECDGARYHSSSWARERDRLRQAVLEGTGWRFHRIWSTDWFYNRDVELQKLLEAVDRTRTVSTQVPAPKPRPRRAIERLELPEDSAPNTQAPIFYKEANFAPEQIANQPLAEMSEASMRQNVYRIIEMEGPLHMTEVAKRLTKLCGFGRAGHRIKERVERTVLHGIDQGQFRWDEGGEDSIIMLAQAPNSSFFRDRSRADSSLRKPAMLPPSEIRQAILVAVRENVALQSHHVAVEVARKFGIASTSQALRDVVNREAQALVGNGEVTEHNGQVRLTKRD